MARLSRGAGAFAAIACAQGLHAAPPAATFDADAQGWTALAGSATWSPTGGAPGGFLAVASGPGAFGAVRAPAQFSGDLSAFVGGAVTFDASVVARGYEAPGAPPLGSKLDRFRVVVTLEGADAATASAATDWAFPSERWRAVALNLDAQTFGLSDAAFASILADVASVRITAEGQSYLLPFTLGLDNFAVVPGPACASLLACAGAFAARRRR